LILNKNVTDKGRGDIPCREREKRNRVKPNFLKRTPNGPPISAKFKSLGKKELSKKKR